MTNQNANQEPSHHYVAPPIIYFKPSIYKHKPSYNRKYNCEYDSIINML